MSARLEQHFGNVVKDLARVQLGYELLQTTDKITEDQPEPEYFTLLATGLAALNMPEVPVDLIKVWFAAGLLRLAGLTPNLITDTEGQRLELERTYNFEYDSVCFTPGQDFTADHIKVLRLLFSGTSPAVIGKVQGLIGCRRRCRPLSPCCKVPYNSRMNPSLEDIVSLCKRRGFIFPAQTYTAVCPAPGTTAPWGNP